MKSVIALTVAAFTLASCGGGGLNSTTRDVGILPSGFAATLDGATDEVVLTLDGVEVARLANGGAFVPGFTTYLGTGEELAAYAATISGDGAVFIVQSPIAELGLAGVQVARFGETDLPSGGSATFNGDYAGLFVNSVFLTLAPVLIQGDAQLTADFAGASISGEITNRISAGFPADDIMLLPTAITSAGAFSGTTTGGNFIGETIAFNGEYIGLIVGATGDEVVGGLSVVHDDGFDLFLEIGAFVAAQ